MGIPRRILAISGRYSRVDNEVLWEMYRESHPRARAAKA